MKGCKRCYAVVNKTYRLKLLTPIDFGAIKMKGLCLKCSKETSKIVRLEHEIVEEFYDKN